MNRTIVCLCLLSLLFSGCFLKKKSLDPGGVRLSSLGVTVKVPEKFKPLPQERFKDIDALGATILEVEPFKVIPRYAYAETSGKGIIVISELQFSGNAETEKYPMNNIFMYQKNLETHFAAGEISSEEIDGKDISTVLMAMMFDEGGSEIALFKGVSYIYPDRFFMIDLYVIKEKAAIDDASGYIDLFYSLGIY